MGVSRREGRAAHHHVGVTTGRKAMLGEMGKLLVLGVRGAKRWATGQWASLNSMSGHALQRRRDRVDVVAMVMIVGGRWLHSACVTILCM